MRQDRLRGSRVPLLPSRPGVLPDALGRLRDHADFNHLPTVRAITRALDEAPMTGRRLAVRDRHGDRLAAPEAVVREVHHADTAPDEVDILRHGLSSVAVPWAARQC